MSDEETTTQAAPEAAADDGERRPRRRRRTKEEMQSELPAFHPSLVEGRVHATAKRVVRTGQYESFDLMITLDFERDPRYSVQECIEMLAGLATQDVNAIAERVQRQIGVAK